MKKKTRLHFAFFDKITGLKIFEYFFNWNIFDACNGFYSKRLRIIKKSKMLRDLHRSYSNENMANNQFHPVLKIWWS